MSLKGKLAINEPVIGNEYMQVLYLFNRLKNDVTARI